MGWRLFKRKARPGEPLTCNTCGNTATFVFEAHWPMCGKHGVFALGAIDYWETIDGAVVSRGKMAAIIARLQKEDYSAGKID